MIVSGTGHRPDKLGGYGVDVTNRLVAVARAYLQEAKPERVITGMALGWDQALGWAAHDEGIPFTAAIPFVNQESRWPALSQTWYKDLLKLADKVVVVSEGGYAAWKMQTRNQWMVDNSDVVLALWNGTDGGTANCVRYAEKKGKPIVNLWEKYGKSEVED